MSKTELKYGKEEKVFQYDKQMVRVSVVNTNRNDTTNLNLASTIFNLDQGKKKIEKTLDKRIMPIVEEKKANCYVKVEVVNSAYASHHGPPHRRT